MTEIQELTRKKKPSALLSLRNRAQAGMSNQARNSWWVLGGVVVLAMIELMLYLYLAFQGRVWQFYALVGAAALLLLGSVVGLLLGRRGQIGRGIWLMLVAGTISFVVSPLFVGGVGIWYAGITLIAMLIVSVLCLPAGQTSWRSTTSGIDAPARKKWSGRLAWIGAPSICSGEDQSPGHSAPRLTRPAATGLART